MLMFQVSTWKQLSTRTSASQSGMSAVRTRSGRCGDTTTRTHRYRREPGRTGSGFEAECIDKSLTKYRINMCGPDSGNWC